MLTHTNIFWSLPSPSAFCQAITDAVRGERAILVNHPQNTSLGFGIQEGLRNGNFIDPLVLIIEDGTNISNTLAPHFNNEVMHAFDLAALELSQMRVVVLRTTSERSQKHCEKYMSEFIEALEKTKGNVKLVLSMQNPSITRNQFSSQFAAIVYDGALRPEEMQTYVSYRMLGRPELGSTSLARHLVTEFASYDVVLAEKLVQMELSDVLNLPQSLTPLMAEDESRWSSEEWLRGSASLTWPEQTHPLREWYLASHTSPLTVVGKEAADKRYWRACLKAISPWLEERRPMVIKALRPILLQLEPDGKFRKKVGDYSEIVNQTELEFNDLCYQHRRVKDQLIPISAHQSQVFGLCHKAKKIRDELAHSRKPALDAIQDLVVCMDDFSRHSLSR